MKFNFSEDMITNALEANGWYELHAKDNWVHKSSKNPDWAGVSKKKAFEALLMSCNLVPRNVDKCWS